LININESLKNVMGFSEEVSLNFNPKFHSYLMGYKLIRKSPYFKRSVLNYDQDVNKNWKGSSLSKLALLDAEKGLHVVTPTIWLPSKPDSHITSIEARYNGISF